MGAGKNYSDGPRGNGCLGSVALSFFLLFPRAALAVQTHGGGEGLFVHQLGHLLFAAAMAFLFYFLHFRPIGRGKAWTFFKLSLLFFFAWNINTVLVHWLATRLPEGYFCGSTVWERRLGPPFDREVLAYYLGSFDHLLCLPGMYFLMQSLRLFGKELERKQQCKALAEEKR